jgi:hypothetical protein
MSKSQWSIAGVALLVAALAGWLLLTRQAAVRITGVDSALPRSEPDAEFVLPAALEAARVEAARRDVRALLVHRRGHRVFDYFAEGTAGDTKVDGGELAGVVFGLALHEPGQAAERDPATVAGLLSDRLWLPLRAGEAWLSRREGESGCCIRARLDDWMRIGDLLLGTGTYLGERFVPADAVRSVLAAREPDSRGDEPFLARDGITFDLQQGVRLWLAPRRQLAILVWADADGARDTLIPNIVLRGLNDAAPAIGGGIGDIVPGH